MSLVSVLQLVSKVVISEICLYPKQEAKAMGTLTFSWCTSMLIGPAIGGIFFNVGFASMPQLIPNLATVAMALISIVAVQVSLPSHEEEKAHRLLKIPARSSSKVTPDMKDEANDGATSTHDHDHDNDNDNSHNKKNVPLSMRDGANKPTTTTPTPAQSKAVEDPKLGLRDIVRSKSAMLAIFQFAVLSLTWTAYLGVFPLWCAATKAKHGLEWSSETIGLSYLVSGLGMLIFMVTCFAHVINRFSIRQAFMFTLAGELALLSLVPCIPFVVTDSRLWLPVVAGHFLIQQVIDAVLCTTLNVMTNRSVHPSLRGRVNGISMGLGSLMRALGAGFFAQFFAFGVSNLHSTFPAFWAMSILDLILLVILWRHPVEDYVALP
eukprot:c9582_g1_i3.p1 GENE.c9582_g1_i3~~c9582_g1_i3.p1  ORF type:complete len:379 (-),score=90.62 c9582_g1_i3:37-1173(-)